LGAIPVNASNPALDGAMTDTNSNGSAARAQELCGRLHVYIANHIEDVEAAWRQLSPAAVVSPGMSYDFIRLWVQNRRIPSEQQHYVVGEVDGQVIAILPLHLKSIRGIKVFTWFPGTNAGCYTPVTDYDRLAALGDKGRAELWDAMIGALKGAGLVYLRSIPANFGGHEGLFDGLGTSLETELLYRAEFSSWTQCDAEQRSRSRRKHDRQQGERLAALGEVSFEEITTPELAHPVIDMMFRQRSERFRDQGIRDCFVEDDLIGFYHELAEAGSGVDVVLHVLRLDGDVVAVRYNIVVGRSMFCLISSMSDSKQIQVGSPGKQCLLRVMQSVFDAGHDVFDMGAGLTDEKRHWCNVQVPLRHHYISLSPFGDVVAEAHGAVQRLRMWAKANPAMKKLARGALQARDRISGGKRSDEL
jgi:CelD/BcsL family acetyltransferase involved in cellulose biosynthesis